MVKELESLSVPEKQALLRSVRSDGSKIRKAFLNQGGILKVGQGKGMEPEPLCVCHSRNPCPIEEELKKIK